MAKKVKETTEKYREFREFCEIDLHHRNGIQNKKTHTNTHTHMHTYKFKLISCLILEERIFTTHTHTPRQTFNCFPGEENYENGHF